MPPFARVDSKLTLRAWVLLLLNSLLYKWHGFGQQRRPVKIRSETIFKKLRTDSVHQRSSLQLVCR